MVAIGPSGQVSDPSPGVESNGRATLRFDSVAGADSYLILRDGKPAGAPLRIEGAQKTWTDRD